MLNWPGIIKHSGDAELTYISDQSEWDNDPDLHNFELDEADFLIDSMGKLFSLTRRKDGYVKPEAIGRSISLHEVLGLIKAHAAQKGSCCVAKIYAPTIDEAFKIIASLEET